MELINLTGRYIIMADDRGNVTRIIEPEEEPARLQGTRKVISDKEGVVVEHLTAEKVVGLPSPKEGVMYIVDSSVARAVDRDDVVTPEMADASMVEDKYVGIRRFLSVTRIGPSSDNAH